MYTNSGLSKSELNRAKDPRHYIHTVTLKICILDNTSTSISDFNRTYEVMEIVCN